MHKSLLRAMGTCVGAFCAWFALAVLPDSKIWLIGWLVMTFFVATLVSCDPVDPRLGFHPSFGYAFQLFTYTQTIIVVEGYIGVGSRDELVVSRLLGQLLGILSAVLVTHLLWPSWAQVDASILLAKTIRALPSALQSQPDNTRLLDEMDEALASTQQLFKDADLFKESSTWFFARVYASADQGTKRVAECVRQLTERCKELQLHMGSLDSGVAQHLELIRQVHIAMMVVGEQISYRMVAKFEFSDLGEVEMASEGPAARLVAARKQLVAQAQSTELLEGLQESCDQNTKETDDPAPRSWFRGATSEGVTARERGLYQWMYAEYLTCVAADLLLEILQKDHVGFED
eukprot:TRINITY_DN20670_c0_g1_i3.p1 TRINITY_DN20670_c0_g1~~TRINITY_DN20670_c0_g1_i3.p1  ORF type:complete len:346 (-),score=91.66 TRINITY_DN20670_c0_g1_i3:201-1238(-)